MKKSIKDYFAKANAEPAVLLGSDFHPTEYPESDKKYKNQLPSDKIFGKLHVGKEQS